MIFHIHGRVKDCLVSAFICFLVVCPFVKPWAQNTDTLVLSIPAAEKIFLQKNLSLLAAKYNIDANEALITQAKLWQNPELSTEQNIYEDRGGFFAHNKTYGQVFVQLSQLIETAGKRSKLAKLSEDNTKLARAQFNDILRSLHYTLVNDMLEINRLLTTKKLYDDEITEMKKLVAGMDVQLNAGNISLKDLTRLKALLFGLQNDVAEIRSELIPIQQELKLLLQNTDDSFIKPGLGFQLQNLVAMNLPYRQMLIDSAKALRPDAAIDAAILDYNNHNLVYQKALAKPNVTLGLNYDQRSNYADNYVGFQIGLPLPLLNRNQGNIRSAQWQVKQQQATVEQTGDRIANEVVSAINKVKLYQEINNKQQLDFSNQYDFLFGNMVNSFQQRQVNMLEFVDFIDNYKDTRLKLIDQQTQLLNAIADLNYTVNKTVIPVD